MEATDSVWMSSAPRERSYPHYAESGQHFDVVVIGAGITGLTCAWLLEQAGLTVGIFESSVIGGGVTGRTSAHLTEALDTRYQRILKDRGEQATREIAQAQRGAIDFIERLALEQQIDCQFERVSGYLYALDARQAEELAKEEDACTRVGVEVRAAPGLPLPFNVVSALEYPLQARFQPLSYLSGLAERLPTERCRIYEGSRVLQVQDGDPCRVTLTDGAWATAGRVVEATHSPMNTVWLQTKLARYQSYVVSGPSPVDLPGLYWDMEDPYHYIRGFVLDGQPHLVVGGEDHKTGKERDTQGALDRLATYAARLGVQVRHAWSAQWLKPVDGLPFIGRNSNSKHVFVATGFLGNGLTFGTIAAQLLADACVGKTSALARHFEATRITPMASFKEFVTENVDYPVHLVRDAVAPAEARTLGEVGPGEGKLVRVHGKRLAVFRDEEGDVHALNPVCTHLGCLVHFNNAEKTWDCPCHGSRFDTEGQVLAGPAPRQLSKVDLEKERPKPSRPSAPGLRRR